MSEYTPTTEQVRKAYKSGAWLRADVQESAWKPGVYASRYYAEFDRWLAAHDRQVRAEAWDEGYSTGLDYMSQWLDGDEDEPENPYREEN